MVHNGTDANPKADPRRRPSTELKAATFLLQSFDNMTQRLLLPRFCHRRGVFMDLSRDTYGTDVNF